MNGIVDMGHVTSFGIPIGLERIVDYIRKNLDNEVAKKCPACKLNVTNTTIPPIILPNITNGTNTTPPPPGTGGSGSTPPPPSGNVCQGLAAVENAFGVGNYTLPERCAYSTDRVGEICCQNSLNSGCYSFTTLNSFMCLQLSNFCQQAEQIYRQCNQNSLCVTVSVFNYFMNKSMKDIYVWLSFDDKSVDALFDKCLASYGSGFSLHRADFEGGFTFDYGH